MGNQTASVAPNLRLENLTIVEPSDAGPQTDATAPGTSRSRLRTCAIMVGLCAAVFLAALNQTIVGTAIPTISTDLKSASGYAWIGAAYLLANAVGAPIWSKLSDIWGRKAILLTAVALYFAFSTICAVSKTMAMLIIGRSLQGAAGGGLIQIVYAIISDMFSMRTRTFYLGLLQMMWAAAGGLGPLIGGIFAEYASWRWVFWINLPIAFVVFCVLWAFLDVHNPKTQIIPGLQAIDWYGCLSLAAFMVTFLLGLNFGGHMIAGHMVAWSSPLVVCLLVAGGVMAFVFILCERKARLPLLPLEAFKSASNVGVLIIGFSHDWVSDPFINLLVLSEGPC
jgi:MFS family permease